MVVSLPCRLRVRVSAIQRLKTLSHSCEAILLPAEFWRLLRALRISTCSNDGGIRLQGSVLQKEHSSHDSKSMHGQLSHGLASCSDQHSSSRYDRVLPGWLAHANIYAFVDSCADNFVTDCFVRRQGLSYDAGSSISVKLADGTIVTTLGSISLRWQFQGESDHSMIRFHVIPSLYSHYCATIGGAYLWDSGTLTAHSNRLRLRCRKTSRSQIFYQGRGHLRLKGTCEDRDAVMFPDLASDIPAMSTDFAYRIGKSIDTSSSARVCLEMPGGRTAVTCGLVTDVKVQLEDDIYHQAFYLIDGLPGDILLHAEFLARTNAFTKHQNLVAVAKTETGAEEGVFLNTTTCRSENNGKEPTPEQRKQEHVQTINKKCCDTVDRLIERLKVLEKKCAQETDPTEKNRLELEIAKIQTEKKTAFEARDNSCQMIQAGSEPVPCARPADKPCHPVSVWVKKMGKVFKIRRKSGPTSV